MGGVYIFTATISRLGRGESLGIYIPKVVALREPKTFMLIDKNFDNITLVVFSKSDRVLRIKRFEAPLRKMLTHRIWIERIQKRYS